MRKIFLFLPVFIGSLFGENIVKGDVSRIQTASPQAVERVYLGSFLAQGHVGAKNIYKIDAPVGGVVQYLFVSIYQDVRKGEQLLIIKSPKLLELESKYIELLIEQEFYQNEVKRLKPLYKRGVVAKKVFFKATNTLEKYKTQIEFYKKLLVEWGLSPKQVSAITVTKTPIPQIVIESPIDGKVEDLQAYPKMFASQGTHLLRVIDATHTHFEVSLPLDIAKMLHVGSVLYIDDKLAEVESIASLIDPRTQTVSIHLMPKVAMKILPEEKRNIKLFLPHNALKVPVSALIEIKARPFVFKQTKEGFKPIKVEILGRSSEWVYLVASPLLDAKTRIAVSDVITLKGMYNGGGDD